MQTGNERRGCAIVFLGAALGAGVLGSVLALWYPGALKRAGSGADAVSLAYFFAGPIAAVIGAIIGGVVMRFVKPLSKTATAIFALIAGFTLGFATVSWFLRCYSSVVS